MNANNTAPKKGWKDHSKMRCKNRQAATAAVASMNKKRGLYELDR